MGRCQNVPKFDFQSQFSMSKIIVIFFNFVFIEEYQFRSTFFVFDIFLITSIFKSLYFLKWCQIFDTSPLTQFSKFDNFLWLCWFLGKNLSNFISLQENSIVIPCINSWHSWVCCISRGLKPDWSNFSHSVCRNYDSPEFLFHMWMWRTVHSTCTARLGLANLEA